MKSEECKIYLLLAFRSSLLSFRFSLSLLLSIPPAMVPGFWEGEPPGNGRALWGTRTDGERTQDDARQRPDGVRGHPDCDWLVSPPSRAQASQLVPPAVGAQDASFILGFGSQMR